MTESEYWRDYELIRDEVNTAIESFYTYLEIHRFAADDERVFLSLNDAPMFWNIQLYSLQTAFFIALGRIFDDGPDAHSIHKLLTATVEHPEFFSKNSLGLRKTSGKEKPKWLDSYLADAFEPTVTDLRTLKKALAPQRKKFDSVYGDIRDYVFAHRIIKKKERVSELFGNTLIKDLEQMLYCLHDLLEVLWQLFHNGIRPQMGVRTYEYKERIRRTTRDVLEKLSASRAAVA